MKRKRQPVERHRRSPYERSLEYAQNRLEKATSEREQCALKLADLDKEIPYLQTVIRALTPVEHKYRPVEIDLHPINTAPSSQGQEAYLARFVHPVDIPRVAGTVVAAPEIETPFKDEEIIEPIA
jgi:hypothetical protein